MGTKSILAVSSSLSFCQEYEGEPPEDVTRGTVHQHIAASNYVGAFQGMTGQLMMHIQLSSRVRCVAGVN